MSELGFSQENAEQEYIDPEYLSIEDTFDYESELDSEYIQSVDEEVEEYSAIEAKYDSMEQIVTDIFPDTEGLEEIDSATEVAFLTREGREWMSKDEEGNIVSQTQQLEGSEYEGLHIEILDELYEQGYSVSEYFEGEDENTLIYFADSRGRISFAHYRRVEEETFEEGREDDVELDASEDDHEEVEDIYLDLTPLLAEGDGVDRIRATTQEAFFESVAESDQDDESTEDIEQAEHQENIPLVFKQSEVISEEPAFVATTELPTETATVATETVVATVDTQIKSPPVAIVEQAEKPSGIELFFEDEPTENVENNAETTMVEAVVDQPESTIVESETTTEAEITIEAISPQEEAVFEVAPIDTQPTEEFEILSEIATVTSGETSETVPTADHEPIAVESSIVEAAITLEITDQVEDTTEQQLPVAVAEATLEITPTVEEPASIDNFAVPDVQTESGPEIFLEAISIVDTSEVTAEAPALAEQDKIETPVSEEVFVEQGITTTIETFSVQTEALPEKVVDKDANNGSIELTIAPEKIPETQTVQPRQDREQPNLATESVNAQSENKIDQTIKTERITTEPTISLAEIPEIETLAPLEAETKPIEISEIIEPILKPEEVQANKTAIRANNESTTTSRTIEKSETRNNKTAELLESTPEVSTVSTLFERSSNRKTPFANNQTSYLTNDAIILEQDGIILRQAA